MAQLPDTRYSLLARLADPADAAAWSEFVEIYEAAIYRYSRSRGLQDSDALDVLQRVWIVAQQAIFKWKPTGRVGSFRNWLVQTTHRICLRTIRDARRSDQAIGGTSVTEKLHAVTDRNNTDQNHDSNDSPESIEQADWQRWAFSWAAAQVQREVECDTWNAFRLTAVEGMRAEEAAEQLKMRIGSVYTAKCRVIARIKQRIQELSQEIQIH
jgi:RNA polymerase sigma-70 factor, ECF subfamily